GSEDRGWSPASIEKRLRPERGAKPPRESERGWGPASINKSRPNPAIYPAARKRPIVWALLALSIVTAGLVIGAWRAPSVNTRVRVAVVPFENETGVDGFDRIARGVADATVA